MQKPITMYRNRACIMAALVAASQVAAFIVMSSMLANVGVMVATLTEFGELCSKAYHKCTSLAQPYS